MNYDSKRAAENDKEHKTKINLDVIIRMTYHKTNLNKSGASKFYPVMKTKEYIDCMLFDLPQWHCVI